MDEDTALKAAGYKSFGGSIPSSSATLPLRITASTYGFGPYGGSSILSGVTKGLVEPQE